MKENMLALRENPQNFATNALRNPEKAIVFSAGIPDESWVKEEASKLELCFEELNKNLSTSCEEMLQALVVSANLQLYFSAAEEHDRANYYSEKIEAYYEKLSDQKFFDFHQQAKLNNLMGYIFNLNQNFLNAADYYEKAIAVEQKCEIISYKDIREYSIQLASSYLMYNDKYCPNCDNGRAKKNCKQAIKAIQHAFKLDNISDEEKKDLWAVFIRASDGLAMANHHIAQYHYTNAKSSRFPDKKTAYTQAVAFFIEDISARIEVLKISIINDDVKEKFLSDISASSALIKQILKNFYWKEYTSFEIPTSEQKIAIKNCVVFMKHYLETATLKSNTMSLLKKIIRLYEEELVLQPVSYNYNASEFWQPASTKNNTLLNETSLKQGNKENKKPDLK